jgi:hypothetical protein
MPAAPTSGQFRSLSYNVAGLPEVLSGSEPAINTPLISPMLNAYDLVLVQEDWANPDPPIEGTSVFHEILVAQVDHPYRSTPQPVPLGADPARPSALLSDGLNRLSRFPFGPLERVMWPDCFGGGDTSDGGDGDCLATKGFSVATTELAPGVSVDVYNLHGEAGDTALDRQYRAEGFAVLGEYIADRSAGNAVIVGGDFNLHSDDDADQQILADLLTATGLTDTRSVVDDDPGSDQIDKFLFRSGGGLTLQPLTHEFEAATFVRPSDGAPLSDHDPLSVDFAWTFDAPPPTTTVTTEGPVATTTPPTASAPTTTTVTTAPPAIPTEPSAPAGSASTVPATAPAAPAAGPSSVPTVAARNAQPAPDLARTGSSTGVLALFGGALLVAGAALAMVGRRRPRHN